MATSRGGRVRIFIEGDSDSLVRSTKTAQTALGRLSSAQKTTDTHARRATSSTSRLNTATRGLGSSLSSAARYAAGAAVAYLSISQAKTAITTTQDLTKATLGLKNNLGLAGKEAGQWAAAARARDVDTTKLGMAFKTLSTQVEGARAGAETSRKLFDDLGVSMKEVNAGSEDVGGLMLQVADGMDKAGAGTERTNVASKLFGRSWQGLAPLIRDGSDALEENLAATEKYGSAIHGQTLKDQEKLRREVIESKLAWQGLQVTFTQAVTPALMDLSKGFQKVSQILANDKLTDEEKWDRVGKIISGFSDDALDAFVKILPTMVEKAAEAAPKIAGALATGIIQSDGLGRVAIGAWLFGPAAGKAMWTALGKSSGRFFGRGFATGALLAMLIAPEVFEWAKEQGAKFKKAGYNLGYDLGISFVDAYNNTIGRVPGVDNIVPGENKYDARAQVQEREKRRRAEARAEREHLGYMLAQSRKFQGRMLETTEDTTRGSGNLWESMGRLVERVGRGMNRDGRRESGKLAQGVVGNVGEMVNKASDGLKIFEHNTNEAMSAFEVKKIGFSIKQATNKIGGLFRATGGRIPGYSMTDDTMVMARGGERFLTPETQFPIADYAMQNTFGTGLDDMLQGTGGVGYAKGGYVPHPAMAGVRQFQTGGLNPAISSIAKWAGSRYGATITSGLRPGDSDSFHGQGAAVDLVSGNMLSMARGIAAQFGPQLAELIHTPLGYSIDNGQRVAAFAQADHYNHVHAAALGGAIVAAVKRLKRVILKGPKGPLRSMGQSSLDMAWKGANAYLAKNTRTGSELGASVPTGPIQRMARQMVTQMWGAGQWPPFAELEQREAGWNPRAVNPSSGAAGLAQALPPSKYPPGAWPYRGLSSAKLQLQWMTGYIRERYGSPSGALAHHNANNWYAKGGRNGGAQRFTRQIRQEQHRKHPDKELIELLRDIRAQQRDLARLAHAQRPAFERIIAGTVSSFIGPQVGLRMQAAGVPGSFGRL